MSIQNPAGDIAAENTPSRVLLIDDSSLTRNPLSQSLAGDGYTVDTANDDDKVLQLLRGAPYDVVLLNVRSSNMNVYQVLKRLKTEGNSRAVPVIAVTSGESLESAARLIQLGADDYIVTPVNPSLAKTRLDSVIDRRRLREKAQQDQIAQGQAAEALAASAKYERDIHIARQIQQSFLPATLPQPPGWEIAARFQPAREVAGDWYDAFELAQTNRIGLVIADVCDKGVGAAMFMGLMRSMMRAFAQMPTTLRWLDAIDREAPVSGSVSVQERRRSLPTAGSTALRNAIEQTNNYIAKNHGDTGTFATTFFALLDPSNGTMNYINGGHELPIIIDVNGQIRERLEPTGLGVGMMPDSEYTIGSAHLEPGEMMITYTDGVPEARDPDRKFFTEKRLLELVTNPPPSAAAVINRVFDSLEAHIAYADQYDDLTMLAIRRAPAE
jgi:serine phosphatase RsbU (regulator of sigma subunit)